MAFLAEHRIPSAHPVADNHGQYLRELNGGKPAALVKRLNGASVDIPNRMQCAEIGKQMVRMHNASKEFNLHRKMVRGPKWWKATADNVMPCLAEEEASLLINELEYQFSHLYQDLPVGVIYADLFLDNALFVGDELTGIIDFYYACSIFFVYDLTVTINDWCTTGDNVRDLQNARVLLNAYQQERKVTAAGFDAWPTMPRAAALRFRLSRLQDKYFPRGGEITHIKDPDEFKLILQDRVENSDQMSKMWDHP